MLRKIRRSIRSFHTAWTRAEDSSSEEEPDAAKVSWSRHATVQRQRGKTLLNNENSETHRDGESCGDAEVGRTRPETPFTSCDQTAVPVAHSRQRIPRHDAAVQTDEENRHDAAIQTGAENRHDAAIQTDEENRLDAAIQTDEEKRHDAAIQTDEENIHESAIQTDEENRHDAAIHTDQVNICISCTHLPRSDAAIQTVEDSAGNSSCTQDAAIQTIQENFCCSCTRPLRQDGANQLVHEFAEDKRQAEQKAGTVMTEKDTAENHMKQKPNSMCFTSKAVKGTKNKIEHVGCCSVIRASISQAIAYNRRKTIIIKHERFFVNEVRISNDKPLATYVNYDKKVHVIAVELTRSQRVLDCTATHEALVAWQGRKPCEAYQVVEDYRQNHRLIPDTWTPSLTVTVKQLNSGSSSRNVQETAKVKNLHNIPGIIIEVKQDYGIMEVWNKQIKDEYALAMFTLDVAYLHQQKFSQKKWQKWKSHESKYIVWHCDLEHQPTKRGSFAVLYKVKLMWRGRKPVIEEDQHQSEPSADLVAEQLEPIFHAKEEDEESGYCGRSCSRDSLPISPDEVFYTEFGDDTRKVEGGEVVQVEASVVLVRTTSGHDYHFSQRQCLLHGVALHHVPLYHVLRTGMAVECELRKETEGEWNPGRVWVGGRRPADPCAGYALLRQWCLRHDVPQSTRDLLTQRAGYEGGGAEEAESSSVDEGAGGDDHDAWHHHLFPTASAAGKKEVVQLAAHLPC